MIQRSGDNWIMEQFKEGHTQFISVNAFDGHFIVKIKNKSLRPSDIIIIDKTNGYPNPELEAIQKKNMFDRIAREILGFLNLPLDTLIGPENRKMHENENIGMNRGVNMQNRAKSEKVGMEGK